MAESKSSQLILTFAGAISRSLKFLERGAERLFKGSAFVGFQRFLRDEDGEQFGFR